MHTDRWLRIRAARRFVRLIALMALVLAKPISAENKLPVNWTVAIGVGPAGCVTPQRKTGFSTCAEAWNYGNALYLQCSPSAIQCNVNTCGPTSTTIRVEFANPGGACNTVGDATQICDDNSVPQFNSTTQTYECLPPTAHTLTKNVGTTRFQCPDGKCEGNPVNPSNGNKLQVETDYVASGQYPLALVRTYNSLVTNADTGAGFGEKWTHNYYRRIRVNGDPNTAVVAGAVRPDGKVLAFNKSGGVFLNDVGFNEKLERLGSGWRLTTTDDEIELYDNSGRLVSISNRAGLSHVLSYNAQGSLASVADSFGRQLTFAYDSFGRLSMMTAPGGLVYAYAYGTDLFKNLVSVTYPDTNKRTYLYANNNPFNSFQNTMSGIIDEKNVQFATFTANGQGFATSTERAGGAGKVTFSFNGFPRTNAVTRFVSATQTATRTYSYASIQGVSALTSITGPACPTCGPTSTTYDANANVTSRIDWNGNRTNYTWDLATNLETSRTEGLTSAGATTLQTRKTSTQWHAVFRLPAVMAEPLRITAYTYDPDGSQCGARGALCSKSAQATTDASGTLGFGATPTGAPRVWTYTYNANGQVLTVDGPRTDVSDVTTYTYYANNHADINRRGNLATITNAAGHVTQIAAYNEHGQPLAIVDPNGLTTTFTYDLRQRLTSRTVGTETTTYAYDSAGLLTRVTLPDGSYLDYAYDGAHRLTGIQDNLGNRIAYTLDLAGNRTQEQVFDPANALAQTRSRVYSNINRLFQELGSLGQTTEYGYDNQGNVTSVKDPLNKTTSNQYDPLNRLKQTTSPAPVSAVTQYGYNGLDALTSVADPRALATSYTVNGLGDLEQQVSPDTGTTVNTYDTAGNLLTQTDAKGQVTSYAYDALNRVTLITFHDGAKQAYAYDQGANGLGRLSSIAETNPANQQTSLIQFAYDLHGRPTAETRMVGGVSYLLSYRYDSSGRLAGLTYPSGRSVDYAFDALGRVSQITTTKDAQTQVVVQNVQYHPFGGAKSWTLGNGQIYARSVDQDGRIASYTLGASNVAIGFDAASRITAIGANVYGYDALDRLTSAVLPSSNYAYGYDAVGNRLTKTTGANTDTYTYSVTSNRLATLTPFGAPTRNFVFDANGSTTDDAVNQYAYDTRGRMVGSTNGASLATAYQVNALGQRIRKTNANEDRVFTYDTWGKLIVESDPGGTPKREYLYLGDIPVGVLQ